MINQFAKLCCVIGGVAITTMANTGYAGLFGSTGQSLEPSTSVMQMAGTQSAFNASSGVSSQDGPFIPGVQFVANPAVLGKTYGEWSADWWKWALSIPADANPILDETGAYCAEGQSGPVWFLAGTFGGPVTRECTIPAGKAIFYPIINAVWFDDAASEDEILTDEEVRWFVANFAGSGDNACQMTSTLDDFDTPNLGLWLYNIGGIADPADFPSEVPAPVSGRLIPAVRSQSPKFSFNFPEGNVLGAPPGENDRLISEGYWVMLPPLTPGDHVLTLHGAACSETEDGTLVKVFETEVEYLLTVVPGRKPVGR